MYKAAVNWAGIAKYLYPLVGAGAGAYTGAQITPKYLGGYSHDPAAVHTATALNSISGLILGIIAGKKGLKNSLIGLHENPKQLVGLAGTEGLLEAIPAAIGAKNDIARSSIAVADANKAIANRPTGLDQVKSIMPSLSTQKGLGIGAAGAGLAGLVSGSVRRKSDKEEQDKTTRGQMVRNDFLKLLLPSLIVGGLSGSALQPKPSVKG